MLPYPKEPVRLALIGAGHRSNTIYKPLFEDLKPWISLVAVCDPIREHADALAQELGARPYYDIQTMVRDGGIEAAVVVAPIPLHHAYSVYLSQHKIHNLIETMWCNTLSQARDMVKQAKENGVVTGVCENFYRYPIDRFAQTLKKHGYIGDIRRIFSYNDHTGYHSNSRWLVFAQEDPQWISAMEHDMQVTPYYESKERYWDHELFRSRFISFPSGLMVIDQAANIKGMLGRQVRPGYTEWHGTRGALVQQGGRYEAPHYRVLDNNHRTEVGTGVHSEWTAEIRCCDYEDSLAFTDDIRPAKPNVISKVERYYNDEGAYAGIRAAIPGGTIDYANPIVMKNSGSHYFKEYGVCVAGHLVDFALRIRGLKDSEFDEKKALMSMMMEVAARESVLQKGAQIALPLEGEQESDELTLKRLRSLYGVDPMDVEAVMALKLGKP
ncbi:MAG: Gfo/Idh/MocA family oxidoreductase [Clostridia bacterium]|nr:Gfo/Idh/MocA family oxidoreductase [Clostridia bacterium]